MKEAPKLPRECTWPDCSFDGVNCDMNCPGITKPLPVESSPKEEHRRDNIPEVREKDISRACKEAIELGKKSTWVVGWYSHNNEVRGPFGRWFEITEVSPEYQKNVAWPWDDAKFCAHAMNNIESISQAYLTLQASLDSALAQLKYVGEQLERLNREEGFFTSSFADKYEWLSAECFTILTTIRTKKEKQE